MASQTSGSAEPAHDPKSSSDYIQFECLPPGGALNRWSARLTKDHDFPGAQVRYHTLIETIIYRSIELTWLAKGHALRSWSPGSRDYEECTASRHCECMVGGQSVQV